MSFRLTTGHEIGNLKAAADYSASTNYGLLAKKDTGALTWAKTSVAGERATGYFQGVAGSGKAIEMQVGMVAEALLGGTVTRGDEVTGDANAKTVTSTAPGDYIIGVALESGVSGDLIPVMILHRGSRPYWSHTLHLLLATIANGDLATSIPLPFAGVITKFYARVTAAATTGSKGSTLNLEIGTTDLTGGSLVLTSANMTPLGAVVAATAITANNSFATGALLSVEAASTTAFAEGSIDLIIEGYVK